jgi:phage portal protein BeeE
VDEGLMGIVKPFEQELEKKLLRRDERKDYQFRFDFEEMLRGNSMVRAQANQIRKANGVITANEWRTSDGMAPSEDPEADKLTMNQNLAGKPTGDSPQPSNNESSNKKNK